MSKYTRELRISDKFFWRILFISVIVIFSYLFLSEEGVRTLESPNIYFYISNIVLLVWIILVFLSIFITFKKVDLQIRKIESGIGDTKSEEQSMKGVIEQMFDFMFWAFFGIFIIFLTNLLTPIFYLHPRVGGTAIVVNALVFLFGLYEFWILMREAFGSRTE